jgi:DNA-binding response OmpR family regulator
MGKITHKIAIIDDDPVTRAMLAKILDREDLKILQAGDGQLGWDMIQREVPDLVITDMLIPRIDGLDLCRQIKRDPILKLVKVILMSAVYKGFHHKAEIRESKADDFIEKPIQAKVLKEKVDRLLLEGDKAIEE